MDHVGDMARYINEGLNAIGYHGAGDLEVAQRHGEYTYNEDDGTLTMSFVWGKDAAFEITIRNADLVSSGAIR